MRACRTSSTHLLAVLLGLLLLGQAGQAACEDVLSYEQLIVEAVAEFERGNFAESYALFASAHGRRPSARTLRGMGVAAFEARRYPEAIEHLAAALQDGRRPLTDAQRQEVRHALVQAERFVVRLQVETAPSDATLRVDGGAPRSRGGALLLEPGPHELEVEAEGYEPAWRLVRVQAGERRTLRIELEPQVEVTAAARPTFSAAAQPPPAPSAPPEPASRLLESRLARAGAIAMVAGEVCIGTGILTALRAAASAAAAEARCGQDCSGVRAGRLRRASYVLLPAGVASLATGAVLWSLDRRRDRRVRATAGCARTGCALQVEGAF